MVSSPSIFGRKFRVFGEDRIKQFNIQPGEEITVQFDIDAHEYNGRWFNEIRAYSVQRGQAGGTIPAATTFAPQQDAAPQASAAPFPPAQEPAGDSPADDLPF